MKSLEDFYAKLQNATDQLKDSIDPDEFSNWKSNKVTQLFFDDIRILIIDRMVSLAHTQPYDKTSDIDQALERGYIKCLGEFLEWSPIVDESND